MFDRSLLKANAKIPLKSTYWTAFGVSTVFLLISGAFSGSGNTTNPFVNNAPTPPPMMPPNGDFNYVPNIANDFASLASIGTIATFIIGLIMFASILGLLFTLFVINPLQVGKDRFFIYNRRYPTNFGTLFSAFKDNYLNAVKTLVVRDILIILWTLLFIIPGVIAGYSYQMMPYILAESPAMPPKRVMELSKQMTQGYKWDLFILDLSFIGWQLLGALACGVGLFFVQPYYEATKTEAYEFLKQNALQQGFCDISEFKQA